MQNQSVLTPVPKESLFEHRDRLNNFKQTLSIQMEKDKQIDGLGGISKTPNAVAEARMRYESAGRNNSLDSLKLSQRESSYSKNFADT